MLHTSPTKIIIFSIVGAVALLAHGIPGCGAQRKREGDSCQATSTTPGTCRLMNDCREEAREIIRKGKRPVICGFKGLQAIICCTREDKGGSTGVTGSGGTAKPGEKAKKYCEEYKTLCPLSSIRFKRRSNSLGSQGILVEGGVPAIDDEFPHMAAIGYGEGKDLIWSCGGSLISDNYVLTAAHCLIDARGEPATYVRLGAEVIEDTLRGNGSVRAAKGHTHRVLESIKHPGYRKPQKYNDVALLKIEQSSIEGNTPQAPLSRILRPACLHYEGDFRLVQGKAVATGWGRLGFGENVTPELQKVSLSVLDNSVCNNTFDVEIRTTPQLPNGIDSSLICAGELAGGKDTCVGDSGGPLQLKNQDGTCVTQVIGITSFGKFCGFQDSPSVYMRVKHFVPWIESVVWP